jgi:hypothetical protein
VTAADTTIHGLRFRRVMISNGAVAGRAQNSQPCDALICQRCTAVLADSGEAERHVCVTRYWMAGMSFADIESVETPDRMRERVRVANNAMMIDLWPHGAKLLPWRKAVPLSERYELLSVLFAELAKMERAAEALPRRQGRTKWRKHDHV